MRREDYTEDPWGRDVVYDPSRGCDADLMQEPPPSTYQPDPTPKPWPMWFLASEAIGLMAQACRPREFQQTG